MRIGIDAKWFYNGNASGKIVIQNLLRVLCEAPLKHELIIILNKKDADREFPYHGKNITLVYQYVFLNNQIANLFSPFLLKKYKPDICMYQYFAPLFSDFKRVIYIHDIIFQSNPGFFTVWERIYFSTIKFLARKADGIITVSEQEKIRILNYRYHGENTKIKVVYNGVNEWFKPAFLQDSQYLNAIKTNYKLPEKFLLYVGRLNERKNIPALLHALQLIKDKDINLVLVGNYDWKMFNLPQMVAALKLTHRVKLLGFVANEDLPGIFCLASTFCYVSYEEGFGMPPLEAMASGIPLVLSDIAVLREICGEAGLYANPRDTGLIAASIDLALNKNDFISKKINIGLERTKIFNWQNAASELINFLETL